ncbi:MAG: hypothetical protein Q4A00_01690 [Flavobacteriaceae bacterium]|nr:hypothetical protein [Flavobacteriaceae bacterium]
MSNKIIKQKLISGDELVKYYGEIKNIFANSYNDVSIFPNKDKMFQQKDARIMFYASVVSSVQNIEILSHLIKDNLINFLQNHQYPEDKILSLSSGLVEDLKGNLFFNVFLRFENFIRLIAKFQGLSGDRINKLSKDLINHLSLNNDYNNLIDLFTYIRNTMHTEGFHTKEDIVVKYKGKEYEFKKDEHVSFVDNDFSILLYEEINKLVLNIINSQSVKDIPKIEHNISGFTYEYEE